MVAILFSFEQKGFHIEYMHEYINSNVKATYLRRDHQWRLIMIANDLREADKICDLLSKKEPYKSIINNI